MGGERRSWWLLPALALTFGGGWASGAHRIAAAGPPPAPPSTAAAEPSETATCTDPAAMTANANLVTELREARRLQADAERAVREAATRAHDASRSAPSRLVTSPEQWSQTVRSGAVSLRTPCASLGRTGAYERRSPNGITLGVSMRRDPTQRAADLGIDASELGAVEEAYERAHARTWARMRAVCEPTLRASGRSTAEISDAERVRMCRGVVLSRLRGSEAQVVIERVAEARAAGRSVGAGAGDEAVVLGAIAESAGDLWTEVTAVLGVEKARIASDRDILCTDELVWLTREPREGS